MIEKYNQVKVQILMNLKLNFWMIIFYKTKIFKLHKQKGKALKEKQAQMFPWVKVQIGN